MKPEEGLLETYAPDLSIFFDKDTRATIPVLPLIGEFVAYPKVIVPILVGRKKSLVALKTAVTNNAGIIFLTAQKNNDEEDADPKELFQIGTICWVVQDLSLQDGTSKVLIEGLVRAEASELFLHEKNYICARGLKEIKSVSGAKQEVRLVATARIIKNDFEEYAKLNKKIPNEILNAIHISKDTEQIFYLIASQLNCSLTAKQALLEEKDLAKFGINLCKILTKEIDILKTENNIQNKVKSKLDNNQKIYYLREQMNIIQKTLDEIEGASKMVSNEDSIQTRIKNSGMPKEAKLKCLEELRRLEMMPYVSAEAVVSRSYLDCMLTVPWKKSPTPECDIMEAKKVLDDDHYGLKEVKERVLEYIAVQKRSTNYKGQILCFVGPPGVGKTSLGRSIAKALKRPFVRLSLGGVRDEAQIRGHIRTYVGSRPGDIIARLIKIKKNNPVFILDEVDKINRDVRGGDTAAALLEVLDPAQNSDFNDRYLEVGYDLSNVMFISTANTFDLLPALLDRMEIIKISGYTELEKVNIAFNHLIKKQLKENGLKKYEIFFTKKSILEIIRYYTKEAGVRNLERKIAKICRKIVLKIVKKSDLKANLNESASKINSDANSKRSKKSLKIKNSYKITSKNIQKYLGVRRYHYSSVENVNRIGQVNGLAWTETGGDLLTIEAAAIAGKGKMQHTGQLGDVMQESVKAALTVVRSRTAKLGIPEDFYEKTDIHVHVPEGATPKDGPSAGIGICIAIISALTGKLVRADLAMTGEITLRGEVLAIGGLKEKLLAAKRSGIKTVLIPSENENDLKEMPKNITKGIQIEKVQWIDEVIKLAIL